MNTILHAALSARARRSLLPAVPLGVTPPDPDPEPTTLLGVGSASTSLIDYPKIANTTSGHWYVDASVSSSGNGQSLATAFKTIQEGLSVLSSGQTLLVKGGTYVIGSQLTRNTGWASATRIMGYGSDRPIIDATGITPNTSAIRWNSASRNEIWHRFRVRNIPFNGGGTNYDGQALLVAGSGQTLTLTLSDIWVSHSIQTAFSVGNARGVIIKDCAAWRLGDGVDTGTNAPDCFTCNLGASNVRIVRCFGANGPDDNYDLWQSTNVRIIDCVAFEAGYYWSGAAAADGMGFKMGGQANSGDNYAIGCIAVGNRLRGFTHNETPNVGDTDPNVVFAFCTSTGNGQGYDIGGASANTNQKNVLRDAITYQDSGNHYVGPNAVELRTTVTLSISNPLFADAANRDYSLAAGSACIGVGIKEGIGNSRATQPTSGTADNIGASAIALEIAKEWCPKDLTV